MLLLCGNQRSTTSTFSNRPALSLLRCGRHSSYMKSKDGWCREDKEEEMEDEISRYLICFHKEDPVAMVHFQFVEEETMADRDAEVAYW